LSSTDPHKNCEIHYAGAGLDQARLVVLAAHGRYGGAGDILKYAEQTHIQDVAWVAPQAAHRSWWGETFLAPISENEPSLSSALGRLSAIMDVLSRKGFGPEQVVLFGFSQGACLVLEHIARHPKPWRGVVAMSGGLIGTSESEEEPSDELFGHVPKRFEYEGRLKGVPIHLGCHKDDPVIPIARVHASKGVLAGMGADVNLDVQAGRMHGVLPQNIQALRGMLLEKSATHLSNGITGGGR